MLVILAILAAIMVPALIGWIDKANEKQLVINGRTAYLAAQTLVSEAYGKEGKNAATKTINNNEIMKLAGLDAVTCSLAGKITMGSLESSKPTSVLLKYTENSKDVYYDGKTWSSDVPKSWDSSTSDFSWDVAAASAG